MFETRLHYGFIFPHHQELDYFYARFPSLEVSIARQTLGKRNWERSYLYPVIGVTFYFSGMGNNPDLKQAYALMPFINFPLTRTKNFMLGFRLAVGAGYFPMIYDSVENPLNVAIGTHINAAINLMFDARYRISRQWTVTGGVSFQHFSNGGWKMPNYGINIPQMHLGVAFTPDAHADDSLQRYLKFEPELPQADLNRIEINVGAGLGYKNMTTELGENFLVYHFHENTFFPVSRKSMFGFGIDVSYDPSQRKAHLTDTTYSPPGKTSYIIPGINAGYALVISRLEILLNLGFYPASMRPNGFYYEKLSIQYNFSKHFYAQVMLKAHSTSAAYVVWSAGYKFDVGYGKKKRRD